MIENINSARRRRLNAIIIHSLRDCYSSCGVHTHTQHHAGISVLKLKPLALEGASSLTLSVQRGTVVTAVWSGGNGWSCRPEIIDCVAGPTNPGLIVIEEMNEININ